MSFGSANLNALPGIGQTFMSQEKQILFGEFWHTIRHPNPVIAAPSVDAGNSPTAILRPGLVMAILQATSDESLEDYVGMWFPFDPTKTDGREEALGVLGQAIRMTDLAGSIETKQGVIYIGGALKFDQLCVSKASGEAAWLALAREQLQQRFIFDDDTNGVNWLSRAKRTIESTLEDADLTLTAADNGSRVVCTSNAPDNQVILPAVGRGMAFDFFNAGTGTAALMEIQTPAGANIIVSPDDPIGDKVVIGGGGSCEIFSSKDGAQWYLKETGGSVTVSHT